MLYEGILVYKQAYKERDLIANFLLRSGEIITGYLYGGQGGGAKKKSDLLQIGYAFRFQVQPMKAGIQDRNFKISEWNIIWQHEKIRNSYKAFTLMNYLCELHHKLAQEFTGESNSTDENKFLFSSLSNALFNLDRHPDKLSEIRKVVFAKLIYQLGVFPEVRECLFCTIPLNPIKSYLFYDEGMASCPDCLPEEGHHLGAWLEPGFASGFQQALGSKFHQCFDPSVEGKLLSLDDEVLEKYLWFHFQMKKEQFKSLQVL